MVVSVTAYYSEFCTNNDIKIIYKCSPRPAGKLVVWYLWYVKHSGRGQRH